VGASVGHRPSLEDVERALQLRHFKLMTVTHVDTSTGVIADVKGLAALARRYETLIVVDGVCSVGGEELRMKEWGVDVALTASQKAVSVPPGLALLMAGPRALEAFNARRNVVANYYADWSNWLPIMQAYEERRASYFATPAVNLVWALNVSLRQILAEGMEKRFKRHRSLGRACQRAINALGLAQVPAAPELAAHTMTAPRYPQGINSAELLPAVYAAGVTIAGGLHPEIRDEYFRIGHMGPTKLGDLLATIGALETALRQCGYEFELGAGVAAAQAAYYEDGDL
jgi:alanine-glyoxylate transaminase/serine-glyoxylate transaminase/serine-pyruvate transaminase